MKNDLNMSKEASDLKAELSTLPVGSIVHRTIRGKDRFYHQWREKGRTLSRYLKSSEVIHLRLQIERRKEIVRQLRNKTGTKTGTAPIAWSQRGWREIAISDNRLKPRLAFERILDFIRNDQPSRILVIKGPPGSGKTTLVRQLIGALSASEREGLSVQDTKPEGLGLPPWPSAPVLTVDLAPMRYAEFAQLFPKLGLDDFLQHGGSPSDVYSDSDAARAYIENLAGESAWETLRALAGEFVLASLRPIASRSHGRSRMSSDLQKVYLHLAEEASARPDPQVVCRLERIGLLQQITVETLRPEFSHTEETVFVHPGLRHKLVREIIFDLLDEAPFASLGAAERKSVRDTLLDDALERMLEECVAREICGRFKSETHKAVAVRLPSGRLALVIADREELVCEMYVVRKEAARHDEQLEDVTDYRVLDAIEHRYGLITERTVLYLGRNARHPIGIAYKNVEKYLSEL